MICPWPYYGGKRRLASQIWQRLGDPTVYVEPFAGSLAVLLHRETPCSREIVADTNGFICNFFRALRADPLQVAWWADYPTVHQDLTARHHWLLSWIEKDSGRITEDADYYDAKTAGWWAWGLSNWIGGEWCAPEYEKPREKRPLSGTKRGGVGCSIQRIDYPDDKRPYVNDKGSGRGSSIQRDSVPHVKLSIGGQGVQAQRVAYPLDGMPNGTRLLDWFYALAQRLARVVVLNRSWESAVTPTLMQHTPAGPKPMCAVFLDPPYLTGERKKGMYQSDKDDDPDKAARDSYEWAVEHGGRYRIAYCAHADDFPLPAGWEEITETLGGIRVKERRHRRDAVYFSPACEGTNQMTLF